ncbi:GPI mannosyltransferase 1 subunit M, partial [Acrasis kona]
KRLHITLTKLDTVKYTDIDYVVFTDASRFVSEGLSPYERATYRYTPILSYLLLPNIYLFNSFGKLLFCVVDILTAYLIYKLLIKIYSEKRALLWTCITVLLNPITINVSTRGNADQLVVLLVLLCVNALFNDQIWTSTFWLALSVHFKIYPIIYAPAIYLYLTDYARRKDASLLSLFPNVKLWKFAIMGLGVLAPLTAVFYALYGYEFLFETYLYHLTRSDPRHNFSVYFYQLYLQTGAQTRIVALLAFIPQFAVVFVAAWNIMLPRGSATLSVKERMSRLMNCMMIQTFLFVAFNKVCTVQYFVWYISLLGFVFERIYPHVETRKFIITTIVSSAAWFVGQALWFYPAYGLEFLGEQTFYQIWQAGILFFLINISIAVVILRSIH